MAKEPDLPAGLFVWTPASSMGERQPDPKRCAASVDGGRMPSHQCTRNARNDEHGHGWCNMHTPSKIRARHVRKARMYDEAARLADIDDDVHTLRDAAKLLAKNEQPDAALECKRIADRIAKEAE